MKLLGERDLKINNDFEVNGWMLCAITHIRNYISDHSDSDNRKQSNSVIKTLSHAFSEDELHFTLDLFWTEYTYFDNNNGSFDVVEFI